MLYLLRYNQKQMHRFLFISFDVISLSSVGSSGLLRAVEPLVAGVVSTASTSVDLHARKNTAAADAAYAIKLKLTCSERMLATRVKYSHLRRSDQEQ